MSAASRADPGTRIGVMACWSCKREVPVKKKKSGKLSMPCPWCDFPHYANEGTEHHANVMKSVTLDVKEQPAAEPAATDKKEPPAPPAQQPAPAVSMAPRRSILPMTPAARAAPSTSRLSTTDSR